MVTRIKEIIKTKEISKEVKPKKIQEVKPKEISVKREDNLAKQLIETGVKVQSKTVDLISEMDKLTKRVDKLLGLFEEASKHVGEAETTEQRINELTNKLESLLEQNKSIARGLILLEKYVRGKTEFTRPSGEKVQEYSGI